MMPFAAMWMDLEIIIPSKVSQKEKDKYHMTSLQYVEYKIQMSITTEKTQTHRHGKQTYSYQKDKLGLVLAD